MLGGAEGGIRTPMFRRTHDPESCASASSATSAIQVGAQIIVEHPKLSSKDLEIIAICQSDNFYHTYELLW